MGKVVAAKAKAAAKAVKRAVKGAADMIRETMGATGDAGAALAAYEKNGPVAFFQSLADGFETMRDAVTFNAAVGAYTFTVERKAKGEESREYNKALEAFLAPFAAWRMARYYSDLGYFIFRHRLAPADVKGNVAVMCVNASSLKEHSNRDEFLADVAKLRKARRESAPKRGAKGGTGTPKVPTASNLMTGLESFAKAHAARLAVPGGWKAVVKALDFTGADASPFEAIQNLLLLAVNADAEQVDAAHAKATAKAS